MKVWLINVLVVLGFIVLMFATRGNELVALVTFTAAAAWVYRDAKKLGVERYQTLWPSPGGSPARIAAVVWILFIVAFPMYIAFRAKLRAGDIPLRGQA
jgi:hypothetical protein